MSPDIAIYAPTGAVRVVAHIGVGSRRKFALMGQDCVNLKFTLAEPVIPRVGDYILLPGLGRYELTGEQTPSLSRDGRGYDYDLNFDAQYRKFANKLMKLIPGTGASETSWTYTDTLERHAAQIVDNMNALGCSFDGEAWVPDPAKQGFVYTPGVVLAPGEGEPWSALVGPGVENKTVTQSYDGTSILDAVSSLAEAYECEWWFEGPVLRFGKCQHTGEGDLPLVEIGDNACKMQRNRNREDKSTRLYVYGSDRNLPSTYRKDLVFTNSSDDEALVFDATRRLRKEWFQASHRVYADKVAATLAFTGECVAEVSSYDDFGLVMAPIARTAGNIPAGKCVVALGGLRMAVNASDSGATVYAVMTVRAGEDAPVRVETPRVRALTQGGVAELRFDKDVELDIPEGGATLALELSYMYQLKGDYDPRTGEYEERRATLQVYNAQGAVEVQCPEERYTVGGIVVEILGGDGEVSQRIGGYSFDGADVREDHPLRAAQGAPRIRRGAKYRIPSLNKALVPSSYFSNKYTVLDRYAALATDSIVIKRLLLPEKDPQTGEPIPGYIDIGDFEADEQAVEAVKAFEEIYPSRLSHITEVFTAAKDDEQHEADGSVTIKPWTSFSYLDDLFSESNPFNEDDYLLPGRDLEITFQGVLRYQQGDDIPEGKEVGDPVYPDVHGGRLTGMTFKVGWLGQADGGRFEIQRDPNTLLPNDIMRPQVGDTFILTGFNVAMLSDERLDYISSAEERLLRAAREYAEDLVADSDTYDATMFCDWAKEEQNDATGQIYELGRVVMLRDPSLFQDGRESRVIGWDIPLDRPYDNPVYTFGEKAKVTRLGQMSESIEQLRTVAGALEAKVDGVQAGSLDARLVRTWDATPPSDANVFSALRSQRELEEKALSRVADDEARGRIAFTAGASFGAFVERLSGGAIDAGGNAEMESLRLRSFLQVYELVYNRVNALEGDFSFADSGTVESVSFDTLVLRKRWDGDFHSFQVGDVIYGYVNDLQASVPAYGKAWGWVSSVDREANSVTVRAYADTEVPGGANLPFAPGMVVARWGNAVEANAATHAAFPSFIVSKGSGRYANTRQTTFYISADDGNIVELTGVDRPLVGPACYGMSLGRLPDGLADMIGTAVNKDQPYVYARGVVVQDLIRVDYMGNVERTQNYRGEWSLETALSPDGYYRSDAVSYDTVTHSGMLWRCMANGNADEPVLEGPGSGSWMCMAGGGMELWQLLPTADAVNMRYGEGGEVAFSPESVGCVARRVSLGGGTEDFADGYDLLKAGATLWYSLDGGTWHQYAYGAVEPLELEDGSGELTAEDGSGALTVGGDDVDASAIGDKLLFELRDTEGGVLARAEVPVVRDGAKGDDGEAGQIAYMAGVYSRDVAYDATGTSTPVVLDTAASQSGEYYMLAKGKTFLGRSTRPELDTPSKNQANAHAYGMEPAWQHVDRFSAVFADVVMADYAKLAKAVFYGNWMFSQHGRSKVYSGGVATDVWAPSTDYHRFDPGDNEAFEPNIQMDFLNGTARFGNIEFADGVMSVYGKNGKNIEIGIGENGSAVVNFYDDDGNLIYGLGPGRIQEVADGDGQWTARWLALLDTDVTKSAADIARDYAYDIRLVPYRPYNHKHEFHTNSVAGQPKHPEEDGKVFNGASLLSTKLEGWYCRASSNPNAPYTGSLAPQQFGDPAAQGKRNTIYRFVAGEETEHMEINW